MTFTSLDLMLHTEALLSAINFLSAALLSGSVSSPEKEIRLKTDDSKTLSTKSSQYNRHVLSVGSETKHVNKLKYMVSLQNLT